MLNLLGIQCVTTGSTMYRDQFVAHELPTRLNGPPAAYQPPSATFDGSTTYGVRHLRH